MGCDINIVAQKKNDQGKWEEVNGDFHEGRVPFNWRYYGMYGFLADVRNYSVITPISQPRGFPDDWTGDIGEGKDYYNGEWMGDYSYSWLSVDELVNYDYDQIIEDRRCAKQLAPNLISGAETCEEGKGERQTLRAFLCEAFFDDLKELQNIGAERIVFGFDN